MATQRIINLNMHNGRKTFEAKYLGACYNCQGAIMPGERVFYPPSGDNVVGVNCCGDLPDNELIAPVHVDELPTDQETPLELVMPRGRTVKDRCEVCFMVPSSNGLHGSDCDS